MKTRPDFKTFRCETCSHAFGHNGRRHYDGKAIFCRCKFQAFENLVMHDTCEHHSQYLAQLEEYENERKN